MNVVFLGGADFNSPPSLGTTDRTRYVKVTTLEEVQRPDLHKWIQEASRLHPDSWCIWRQGAGVNETGLAALPEFWQRVDALGEARYYARVDMPGMP